MGKLMGRMGGSNRHREVIEILPTSLLEHARVYKERVLALSKELRTGLGWHYMLDLSWAAREFSTMPPGSVVIDAGAGRGLMQWYLSDQEIDVISVDRIIRRDKINKVWRDRFPVMGLRGEKDLAPVAYAVRESTPRPTPPGERPKRPQHYWARYRHQLSRSLAAVRHKPKGQGIVYMYDQDIGELVDICDESVDAIVSISSLEHNSPEGLRTCVAELLRVLKPGGVMVATLGAAKNKDWYHEPSKGWCYTEASLKDIFQLPHNVRSNYDRYDALMKDLTECDELKDNLAEFYFKSDNNGMPWGKWDPQYQSVGVVKVKT